MVITTPENRLTSGISLLRSVPEQCRGCLPLGIQSGCVNAEKCGLRAESVGCVDRYAYAHNANILTGGDSLSESRRLLASTSAQLRESNVNVQTAAVARSSMVCVGAKWFATSVMPGL